MSDTLMRIRLFTIADYEDEEAWLTRMHRQGWKLDHMTIPCFYFFNAVEPEDCTYRLDYRNAAPDSDYLQMLSDYGWEYFDQCMGWNYFRRLGTAGDTEGDTELFSDAASKVAMIQHILLTRMLPLLIIFLTCLIPNLVRSLSGTYFIPPVLTAIIWVMFFVYIWLFVHCGIKLSYLKKKYSREL